jgi:serine/threonine protein kinase
VDPDLALDFVEGRCTPAQVQAIERHVDRCALCRQFLSELARDSDAGPPVSDAPKAISASLSGTASPEERLLEQRLERGRAVGRYLLLDQLGSGGMGVVYSAYDPGLDRKVAVKLLRLSQAEHKSSKARLLREAQAMARLQHPNVLAVFDAGTLGDEVFIAMELVHGSNVTAWLAQQRRSWREILQVFISAGRGLAAAHAADLVHRDFKPDNVLIGQDGRVRVTDFGLARDLGAEHSLSLTASELTPWMEESRLTRTGMLLGSPAYMSPEQFQSRNVDARSDQFSFCVAPATHLMGARSGQACTPRGLKRPVHRTAASLGRPRQRPSSAPLHPPSPSTGPPSLLCVPPRPLCTLPALPRT